MTDRTAKAAPLLALIRAYESDGAVKAQGAASSYDVVFGGIPKEHRPQAPLTTYPIGEVIEWQRFVVSRGAKSSAAGAYQIVRPTLEGLDLPDERIFDAACQDEAAMILLDRRGWDECEAGRMKPVAFADMLAREWASLPVQKDQRGYRQWVKRGQSYYTGDNLNKAHATPEAVMAAIAEALKPIPDVGDIFDVLADQDARLAALEAWAVSVNLSLDILEKRHV